jgi:hypothetical protein
MRFQVSLGMLGVAIAIATVLGGVIPSSAQVPATCTASTRTFVQAVGSPGAPILVPMNLPVTVCTLPTNVQVIIPAFQILGARPGSVIVPATLRPASCALNLMAAPSVGTGPVLQVFTVTGSTVVASSTTIPAAVVTVPITCF